MIRWLSSAAVTKDLRCAVMLRPENGPNLVLLKQSLLAQLETVVDPRKSHPT